MSGCPTAENVIVFLELHIGVAQTVDITVPTYATIIPRILAYNKYGDLVDENFFDAQLSCDAAIGTCEGNAFIAGSTPGVGTLTATYGDCTISKQIELVKADVALKLGNILIDDVREYLLEVVATADREQYNYDPGEFQWEVADRSIADIDVHGMLRGIKNGTTTITGTRFSRTCAGSASTGATAISTPRTISTRFTPTR